MTLVSMEVAKSHLRVVGADEDADIELKLEAAEQAAASYLNRSLYADQTALDAATAASPTLFATARLANQAAVDAAMLLEDVTERAMALAAAAERFAAASLASVLTYRGMVITSAIKAAILLSLGHLYENREGVVVGLSVAEMPQGAMSLLRPHRIGVGL